MDHETLKRRTFGSVLWMVAAGGWASIASFVTFAILARLLDPYTFGVFTLDQIVFSVVTTLITTGFNDFIIQRRDLTEALVDTLFWTSVGLGLFAAGTIWISADFYAQIMKVPEAAAPLRYLALAIPIEALATVHLARSLRDFSHKVIALRTFASTIIGGGLAIAAAYRGMGVWSLVLQLWATSLLNAAVAWQSFRWLPQLRFSLSLLGFFVPFCIRIMASNLLWVILLRIPEIVLGRFLGPTAVAHYRVGWRLTETISAAVLQPMGGVALAMFSKLRDERARFEAAYVRFLNAAAIILFPILCGSGVLADELVPLLFGPKWAESVIVVKILAFMAVPLVLNFLLGQALTAIESIRGLPRLAAIQVAGTLCVSILAAPFGLAAVCVAYVLLTYAMMPYIQHLLYSATSVSFSSCERAIRLPLLACGAMITALYALHSAIHAYISQDPLYLVAMVTVGSIVYGLSLYMLDKNTFRIYTKMIVGNLR
jgi:O-antigen/teichoic acid export membrane protein